MSNIATGIGLSGQLKVDDSGQLNRLAAEQAAAQQRLKEQAAKKKADDDLLKDIASNTIFSKTMIQPRNQADAESRLTQGLADIVKTIGEGEGNVAVSAYSKLNQLSQEINTLAQVDKKQTEIWTEAFKNPEQYRDYFRPVEINGKTYNNGWEAYNAGEDVEAIANGWKGTEHVVMYNEVLGGKMYMPNPQATIGAFEAVLPSIKVEMYSQLQEGKRFTGPGDETFVEMFRTIGPEGVESLVGMANGNMAVRHFYETEMRKDGSLTGRLDDNANIEIERRIREDIERGVSGLRKTETDNVFTPPAPKTTTAKPTLFEKKYSVSPMSVIDYGNNKTSNRITFNPIGTPGTVPMRIPKDAKEVDQDGVVSNAAQAGKNMEVSPVGVEWKDGEPWFLLNVKDAEKNTKTILVLARQGTFSTVASGLYLTKPEEQAMLAQYIKDVARTDPKALEKEFWKSLGITDDQFNMLAGFGASPAKVGPQKMDAQGRVYEEDGTGNQEEDEDFTQYKR